MFQSLLRQIEAAFRNATSSCTTMQNNEENLLIAVLTQNGLALQYASRKLKNNEKIVLAAVTQDGSALQYASDGLKNNEEIVLAAVTRNWQALEFASDDLKLAAVRQHWRDFYDASGQLEERVHMPHQHGIGGICNTPN
mmetsp:Transcript_8724/g.25878  ORF Transcript_8724/g.25878 Transcript_8724/m.25878 type:complete len:139 (+) Transcript_8724:140-556(+)